VTEHSLDDQSWRKLREDLGSLSGVRIRNLERTRDSVLWTCVPATKLGSKATQMKGATVEATRSRDWWSQSRQGGHGGGIDAAVVALGARQDNYTVKLCVG
jgi:hypothetical protein